MSMILSMSQINLSVLFADGTDLLYPHKDARTVENVVSCELLKTYIWFCFNKLSVNI